MTEYIRPDDVLNIYYSISENNIGEIVNITKENNDITSDLDNLQNVKKIQWSPDKEEHINKTFEFDIEGVSDTRKVRVVDVFNDAIFQWKISEGSNEIIYDDISNQDGLLTQESMWVEGETYVNNYAIKNDSNNVVEIQNKWNNFGSNMDDDFAIALTIKTTDKGQLLSGYDNNSMRLEWTTRADSDVPGDVLGIMIRDDNNNDGEISSDTIINDGKLHRCVLVKKTNDVHNWEIWIDGKKEDINVHRDAWSANTKNFESPCHFFAVDKGNGLERHLEGVLDNIIFASNSISKTEIVNDYENQPWVNELNGLLLDDWSDKKFESNRDYFATKPFKYTVNSENSEYTTTKRPKWSFASGTEATVNENELVLESTSDEVVLYHDFGRLVTPQKWIWRVDMDSKCSSGSQDLTLLANSTNTTGNGRLKESIFARFDCGGSSNKATVDLRSESNGNNPAFITGEYDNTTGEHILIAEFDGIDTWTLTVDDEYIGEGIPEHNITEGRYTAIGHNTSDIYKIKELQIL